MHTSLAWGSGFSSIERKVHVKAAAGDMICRLFVSQATDAIKEAFEEKRKLSAARYESGGVTYNTRLITCELCDAEGRRRMASPG